MGMTIGTGPARLMHMISTTIVVVEPGQGMTHFASTVIYTITILIRISKRVQGRISNICSSAFEDNVTVAARYREENILQSGWLIGEGYLSKRPAVLEFKIEKGKVIVIAFPAQHRAQVHGTFKFLFNAIYYGPAADVANP